MFNAFGTINIQPYFNTHNWQEYSTDLICKDCNIQAAWIDGRSYLIKGEQYLNKTCNNIMMNNILK